MSDVKKSTKTSVSPASPARSRSFAKRYRKYLRPAFMTRFAVVSMVLVVEVVGLWAYTANSTFIHNALFSKNTLLQSYLPSFKYELSNASNYIQPSGDTASVPVLVYHGLVSKSDQFNVLIQDFRKEMFALHNAGYHTISADDYVAFMQGKKHLPAKSFLLTFDDGRKDSFYNADPILQATGFRATMFIIVHHAFEEGDKSHYYLDAGEVKRMESTHRWDIEAHTFNGHDLMAIGPNGQLGHFYSNYLWLKDKNRLETEQEYEARVIGDLTRAKQELQDQLHITVNAFAYPFGDYGQQSENNPGAAAFVLAQVNKLYPVAFAQEDTSNDTTQNYFGTGGHQSSRIEVPYNWTSDNLLKMMQLGSVKTLPLIDSMNEPSGWLNVEGSYDLAGDGLSLQADPTNTTDTVVLDGSRLWTNYTYAADINWTTGGSVALYSRFQDKNNYTICDFTGQYVSIREELNGHQHKLAEMPYTMPYGVQHISMSVQGQQISCGGTDGSAIVTATSPTMPAQGGVGVSIWDATRRVAHADITKVSVKATP